MEVNQSENRYVEGNRAAWRALEDAYKAGKLKAIGISNFQVGDIESLLRRPLRSNRWLTRSCATSATLRWNW
ncbi:MAG: aldo/keto reductase [Waltera sp.]